MAITNKPLQEAIDLFLTDKTNIEYRNNILECMKNCSALSYEHNIIFVYGTLRRGQYNYDKIRTLFGDNSLVYLDTTRLSYLKLYDLGNYPAIIRGNHYDKVLGEVMYCTDEVFQAIKHMEIEAGYEETTSTYYSNTSSGSLRAMYLTLFTAGDKLVTLIYKHKSPYRRIECGDWSVYLMLTKEEVEEESDT